MALYAAIALIWRIKICEILAMACAPIGAAFTAITLLTGIWGKPMWGAWWDWDPRLTTELILLFLYLGVIGLYHAIDDRRQAARAAALLAIVGVALLPVIRYSVVWWNSLHQGQSIRLLGPSAIDASMLLPLWLMVIGTVLVCRVAADARAPTTCAARPARPGSCAMRRACGATCPTSSPPMRCSRGGAAVGPDRPLAGTSRIEDRPGAPAA